MPYRRTLPERLVADALRAFPYPVEEQARIGKYRPDFRVGLRLLLECDGAPWHSAAHDEPRDRALERHGYVVVRLPATEILALSPLGLIARLDTLLRTHEHAILFP